jgi:hypothetical protein
MPNRLETLTTNSGQFTPIPGLSLILPKAMDILAPVILNFAEPFCAGERFSRRNPGHFGERHDFAGCGEFYLRHWAAAELRSHADNAERHHLTG